MKPYNYSLKLIKQKGISSDEYSHILLLLYWPVYGLCFLTAERFLNLNYHDIHCALDDKIPFSEIFVIPYYLWFLFLGFIMVYSFFFDIPAFKKYMWFTIITYSVTVLIYLVYPNEQNLRPTEFPRDNLCTDIVKMLYAFDTNTNVCPSLHVIGSFAVLFSAWDSKYLSTAFWRILLTVLCFLICISTVFLKQHSVIDILAALILCFAVYPFVFSAHSPLNKQNQKVAAAQQKETVNI